MWPVVACLTHVRTLSAVAARLLHTEPDLAGLPVPHAAAWSEANRPAVGCVSSAEVLYVSNRSRTAPPALAVRSVRCEAALFPAAVGRASL
jgi:hypothetical protein